jgi:predicted site-specific integrase-resolvase
VKIANDTDLTTAATRLGVSYVAARNWVITGKLRGERRYGRWVVDADHLDRLVTERTAGKAVEGKNK